MKLAIFDLDNTLLCGDSDYLWGQFLCEHGYTDTKTHKDEHKRYYDDYKSGRLNINEFLEFQLRPLVGVDPDTLSARREQYLDEKIKPIILNKAVNLLDDHKQKGHVLLIITATNRFLTEPIAGLFGVDNLIASDIEIMDGFYTGKPLGIPSYADGKVTRLQSWLLKHQYIPDEYWFYSDSHNDLPLFNYVTHPIAVDPDNILREEAEKRGWPIISLR